MKTGTERIKIWKSVSVCLFAVLLIVSALSVRIIADEDENSVIEEDILESIQDEQGVATPPEGYAYAILTKEGKLIFFRSEETYEDDTDVTAVDTYDNSYAGRVYADIESTTAGSRAPWYEKRILIKEAYVASGQTIEPRAMTYWFEGCSNMTSFNGNGFSTSYVKHMEYLFYGCSSLTSLNLSDFNTANVTKMGNMFFGCSSLETFDLKNFNVTKVTDMNHMFYGCSSLTSLDLSNFKTSALTNCDLMFSGCSSLTSLNLKNFNTAKIVSMSGLFFKCTALTSVTLGSDFRRWKKDSYLPTGIWFNKGKSLLKTETDLYDHYPENADEWSGTWKKTNAYAVLKEDGDLVFLRSTDTYGSSDSTISDIYDNEYTGAVYGNFETSKTYVPWSAKYKQIRKVYVAADQFIRPTWMRSWFSKCSALQEVDLNGFDTSQTSSMIDLFSGCSALETLDLSVLDTANVENMSGMFRGCSALTDLNLENVSVESVTDMTGMFADCSSLETLDLSSFDTSGVESMNGMFSGCSSLSALSLDEMSTASVTDLSEMFAECSSLEALDLSSFDTSNTESMNGMFRNCSALTSISLENVSTENVTDLSEMFAGCSALETLDLSGFVTDKAETMTDLFSGCSALVSVKLGEGFVKWQSDACLPVGLWINEEKGLKRTEKQLCKEYPSDPEAYSGTWIWSEMVYPKPNLAAIYNSANGADIRFDLVDGIETYYLMQKYNGVWKNIKTLKMSDIAKAGDHYKAFDTTIKNNYGKGYIYSIAIKDGEGNLVYSTKGLALYRLAQPSIKSIVSQSKGSATVTWSKTDAHGYEIQYSTDGRNWTKADQTTETELTINGLKSGTRYYFRIRCQKTNADRGTTWSQYSANSSVKVK